MFGSVDSFDVSLQVYHAVQDDVAFKMWVYDRLTIRMVAEMFAPEVFFEVARICKFFQADGGRQVFITKAEDALGGFVLDRERF